MGWPVCETAVCFSPLRSTRAAATKPIIGCFPSSGENGGTAGCVAGVVVTGVGEFYTKDVARDMVFAANQAGCAFLGRPLVEATGSMRNFRVQAQIGGVDERTAFRAAVTELIERLDGWQELPPIRHVLALHASQRSTSNTLAL